MRGTSAALRPAGHPDPGHARPPKYTRYGHAGPLTGMAAVLAQGMRGSLPTILSTGLRGPTMLIAQ
jgi:hypothetical protein